MLPGNDNEWTAITTSQRNTEHIILRETNKTTCAVKDKYSSIPVA
jgi:hypothetical protein